MDAAIVFVQHQVFGSLQNSDGASDFLELADERGKAHGQRQFTALPLGNKRRQQANCALKIPARQCRLTSINGQQRQILWMNPETLRQEILGIDFASYSP